MAAITMNTTAVKERHPYKRDVTHTEYKHKDKKVKKGGWSRMLHQHITENTHQLSTKAISPKAAFQKANNKFMQINPDADVLPIWVGGFFLILIIIIIIGGFKFPHEILTTSFIIPSIIALLGFSFFVVYYFTKPEKEFIWNREDGVVTFPGFMWRPNITMPIKKVIFIRSAPSAQGIGSHLLQIARPDKSYSLYMASLDCTCYEDLSFFLWYMDKNRPLPPGTAFDPYRQQDFERRKEAGFPLPLFPAAFDTPEATPAQQAERNRYWREEDYMCPEFKREKESILFDVNIHTDWIPFRYKDASEDGGINSWHRYTFEDGTIIYMRTDEQGRGYTPPAHTSYETTVVSVQKS